MVKTEVIDLFGTLALISSIAMLALGLPKQIWSNYRRKSTEGVEPFLMATLGCIYVLWGIYGTLKLDYFLIIANWPGVALILIIFFQMYAYRRHQT